MKFADVQKEAIPKLNMIYIQKKQKTPPKNNSIALKHLQTG